MAARGVDFATTTTDKHQDSSIGIGHIAFHDAVASALNLLVMPYNNRNRKFHRQQRFRSSLL
jgi:hypothetical protein